MKQLQMNQPEVLPMSVTRLAELASQMTDTSKNFNNEFLRKQIGTRVTPHEAFLLSDLFTTSFRRLKNRNEFMKRVFFIYGLHKLIATCLSFLMLYSQSANVFIRNNFVLFVALSLVTSQILAFFVLTCFSSMRKRINSKIIFPFLILAPVVLYGSISAAFNNPNAFYFANVSLMFVFFLGSLIASQRKFEATGLKIILFLLLLATALTVAHICLISLIPAFSSFLQVKCLIPATIFSFLEMLWIMVVVRCLLHRQELNVNDHIYGADILFLCTTSMYAVYMAAVFIHSCRQKKTVQNAVIDEIDREAGIVVI